MREIFADTAYWIALTNLLDQHHVAALQASSSIGTARIVTTDAVLTEYLNALAARGETLRQAAIKSMEAILANPAVTVVGHTRKSFLDGFALYKARPDKGYSLTDCFSMMLMRKRKITQVLTTDRHFEQEGFVPIMVTSVRHKSARRKG
ncbi:MAG: PIN domain-containing protein [Candidatus Dadabacteria bacterium]|nr:PIN domain-containing protein [Candidatus Dadabacteria bacterium]MDE0403924.1 PIN domain-containing protein [Nitrospira sp.]MDE0486959.1 PIN domain-containing protein [Nitrospira sp.]